MNIVKLDVHSYGGMTTHTVGVAGVKEIVPIYLGGIGDRRREIVGYKVIDNDGDYKRFDGQFNFIAYVEK